MKCPKCDAENPFDAMLCVSCQEPISPAIESKSSKKLSRSIIFGIAVVIVLVIIVAVALIYW